MFNLETFFLFIIVISLIFFLLEIISKEILKKTFLYKRWYFKSHIFTNFISSENFSDDKVYINIDNFRETRVNKKNNCQNLYMMGCCNFFEGHLKDKDTLAFKIDSIFKNLKVFNASLTHYTTAHMLHRLVLDLQRNIKINNIILSATVNDILTYIHHVNGKVKKDHSHFYKTIEDIGRYDYIKKINSNFLQLLLLYTNFFSIKKLFNYENHFYDISKNFVNKSNYNAAKNLIDFSSVIRNLNLILAICNKFNIRMTLCTFAYIEKDFDKFEVRKIILKGIKELNSIFRVFAKDKNLELIDFEKNINFNDKDIKNKWHFTDSGNNKRCELVVDKLKDKYYIFDNPS